MLKKTNINIELIVILLALVIGINSQFSALTNKYVINDDVMQHVYWMQQFRDNNLFKNDLLTEYAKNYQPWGYIFLYFILSFIIDPLILSKFLPIVLLIISTLYMYKLVKYITNTYTGFLAAFIFMITPTFINKMSGSLPRAFGYPLVLIFLYYLIKKDYLKSSLCMILQSLFYPMMSLLSTLTYLFTFIKYKIKIIYLDRSNLKVQYFILAALICIFILGSKYLFYYNPSIGTTFSRGEMIGNPEFYKEGRYGVLPTAPLLTEIRINMSRGIWVPKTLNKIPIVLHINPTILRNITFLIMLLFFISEIIRKQLHFPLEILLLFFSSILMFKISDLFLFKLFLPERYIQFPVPIISLIIYSIIIGQAITKIKIVGIKRFVQALVLILIFLDFNVNKNIGLIDMSHNKDLYEYLNKLPEDTMIAAHPKSADGIPTFTQRKVYIKYELSHPFFDKYWETIKKRTNDFFNAYYAEDPKTIFNFCEKNDIDYLVVDRRHFSKEYLKRGKIYFEPFNTYIKTIIKERKDFVLADIPDKDKLFIKDNIFVIGKDDLCPDPKNQNQL